MSATNQAGDRPAMSRRSLLYATTAAVGAAGIVAAAWPFIDHLNPDAAIRASGDVTDVALADLQSAQQRVLHWHNLPIFVVRRTTAMLEALREKTLVERMVDPRSEKRQQPAYAANWHRSIDPAYAVLVGVCTYCGCVPQFLAEALLPDDAPGGYVCACCASHFDSAGRAHSGPAQYNLPVPPYDIVKQERILVGKNPAGELFTLQSVERL
jgi:ubiquinol-cytochrome c reductase iron-sulfur subunit